MKITIIIPAGKNSSIIDLDNFKRKKIPVIIERGNNPSKNRNKGANKAKTPFIAFINAHTSLENNWLKETLNFFKKHPEIDIVGGPQLTPPDQGFFPKVSGYALSSIFGAAETSIRYKKAKINLEADESILTSANLICKKEVLKRIKFDERMYPGEDPKFISDAIKAGFKVAYTPKIVTYNERRAGFFSFFKQIYNYGKTRPQKESFLETLKRPYFLIPSLLVIYLILLPILLLFGKYLLIPLLLYLLLDFVFSLLESIKNQEILPFLLLMIIFPIIHISYGLGFLIMTLKKII